ncbi:MAG TPA: amidase [Polyangiaceae bacterium]|nr:amidase [Polyangiaceae bacterium]
MSSLDDVLALSALDQARLLRARTVSSEELTRACLDRIARHDGRFGSFVQVMPRRALASARRKDRVLAKTAATELPPLFGVPIGVKDLNMVRGTFTRAGSRAYRYFLSPVDDTSARKIREAGFVILGKLATSELGAMPVTETDLHPPARNPWDVGRTPGGSSGGSGAAVAAGLLPLAHGSDGAGSIRIPSSFCHLFGIKPSRGRVEDVLGRPDRDALPTCGPLARTVEDAAALLDVLAGITVGKPHWAPPPPKPFLELSRVPPRPLRIRFTTLSPLATTTPEVKDAVTRVLRVLEGMGHAVEEGPPPEATLDEFLPLWQRLIGNVLVVSESVLQPVTRWLHEAGKKLSDAEVTAQQHRLAARILAWFGDADVWVTPTVAGPPPEIGAWKGLPPREAFEQAAHLGAFTALYNVSGQPASSVPAGVSRDGHPIGVQLAGRVNEDALVLALSRELEGAMPWRDRRAPTAVGRG